jgi:hypothetical protein
MIQNAPPSSPGALAKSDAASSNEHPLWNLALINGDGRSIPATSEMMMELSRYLLPNEDTPLVLPIGATAANGGTQTCAPLTRAALHATVKQVLASAAARLRERDETSTARANLLEKASTHCLRHSAGSGRCRLFEGVEPPTGATRNAPWPFQRNWR